MPLSGVADQARMMISSAISYSSTNYDKNVTGNYQRIYLPTHNYLTTSSSRKLNSAFEFWKIWYVKRAKILGTAKAKELIAKHGHARGFVLISLHVLRNTNSNQRL